MNGNQSNAYFYVKNNHRKYEKSVLVLVEVFLFSFFCKDYITLYAQQ